MWIVLDTNIYFNNWFASSANFEMLLNFCNNRRCTLLLPEIAAKEVNNKYQQTKEKLIGAYGNTLKDLAKLGIDIPNEYEKIASKVYDINTTLQQLTRDVQLVSFKSVPHSLLVEKALKPKLPFRENEKGYRDSLFWISLLNYAKKCKYTGDIVFINQNSKDFYIERAGIVSLHPDLQEDIDELGVTANFIIHDGIKSFIDSWGTGDVHDIDWAEFYAEHNGTLDSAAGEEAIDHLDSRPLDEIKNLLSAAGYDQRMLDAAFEVTFEDWEGVEDSEIINIRKFQPNSGELFIGYKFDFRTLDVKLLMTHTHYYADKYFIDSQGEPDLSDDIVEVSLLVRADLEASVIFHPKNDVVSSVEINRITLRKLR